MPLVEITREEEDIERVYDQLSGDAWEAANFFIGDRHHDCQTCDDALGAWNDFDKVANKFVNDYFEGDIEEVRLSAQVIQDFDVDMRADNHLPYAYMAHYCRIATISGLMMEQVEKGYRDDN